MTAPKSPQNRPKGARLLVLACLLLAGCALIPQRSARPLSHRAECRQALERGWCVPGCRHKPEICCAPKDVSCSSDGLCCWTGCDGSLIWGWL